MEMPTDGNCMRDSDETRPNSSATGSGRHNELLFKAICFGATYYIAINDRYKCNPDSAPQTVNQQWECVKNVLSIFEHQVPKWSTHTIRPRMPHRYPQMLSGKEMLLGFLMFHKEVSSTRFRTRGGQLCLQPSSDSSHQWGQTTKVRRTKGEEFSHPSGGH